MNASSDDPYDLDAQIGFLLRRATQRHLAIFHGHIPDLTPTQFATLAKLFQQGALSQNALGRETAMDGATIKGVVDRLKQRELVRISPDKTDRRRSLVTLSDEGRRLFLALEPKARQISGETLAPLSAREQARLLALLSRLT